MFEVRGVCDPSPAALAFMAAEFGLPTFPTIEALLDVPLDTVVIASPDALHHEQALMALQRARLGIQVNDHFCCRSSRRNLVFQLADFLLVLMLPLVLLARMRPREKRRRVAMFLAPWPLR